MEVPGQGELSGKCTLSSRTLILTLILREEALLWGGVGDAPKRHWHKGLPGIDRLPTGGNGRILRLRRKVTEWRGGERGSG